MAHKRKALEEIPKRCKLCKHYADCRFVFDKHSLKPCSDFEPNEIYKGKWVFV